MTAPPCGGDAYEGGMGSGCGCCLRGPVFQSVCLGDSGYRRLAIVASEVAAERGLRIRRLESKLMSKQGEADMYARLAEIRR